MFSFDFQPKYSDEAGRQSHWVYHFRFLSMLLYILNRAPKQRFVFLETERMTIQKCPSVCVRSKRLGAAPLAAAWLSAPLWVCASLLWSPKGKEAIHKVNLFYHIISSFMFCQHYLHMYWYKFLTLHVFLEILWVKNLECEDKKPTMSLHELGPYSCSRFSMSNYLKVNAKSLSTYLVSLPTILMFATAGSAICILILLLPTNKKTCFSNYFV